MPPLGVRPAARRPRLRGLGLPDLGARLGPGGSRPAVLYDVDGRVPAEEWIAPQLEGYRATAPVRCGNAAGEQHQHDVFGEVLDCAYQWAAGGGS